MEKFFLLFILAALSFAGCSDPEKQRQLEETLQGIQRTLSEGMDHVTKAAPSREDVESIAGDELAKLSSIEYHVIDLDRDMSASQMDAVLVKLGAERWECFSITQIDDKIRIFCKRRPESYLRYVQRFLPLPLP